MQHLKSGFFGKPVQAPLLVLAALLLSSCTLDHSRQSTHQFLQGAQILTDHSISRSADWTLSSGTRLCQATLPLAKRPPAEEAEESLHRYQYMVNEALYRALQQSFRVQQVSLGHSRDGDRITPAAYARVQGCEVLVQARVLKLAEEVIISRRHGPEHAGNPVPGEIVVQVILQEVATERLLDVAVIRSRAGVVTPVQKLPDQFIAQAMQQYVARIAATPRLGLHTPRP